MELLHNFLLNLESLPPKKLNVGADSAVKISGLKVCKFASRVYNNKVSIHTIGEFKCTLQLIQSFLTILQIKQMFITLLMTQQETLSFPLVL